MSPRKAVVTDGAAMKPPPGGVSIRMYRQGLGDCFLLAFDRQDDAPFFMLIDCGVIVGTTDPGRRMTEVAAHIRQATGGRLDVLVLTHEHWDHISGFVEAKDVFKEFKGRIGELWLGWTEKPDDDVALQLQSQRRRRARALQAFADRFRPLGRQAPAAAGKVDALLAFHGLGPVAAAASTSDALDNAREFAEREPRYCRPGGKPIELGNLQGVRFYVLGPPEDPKDIRKTRPSTSNPETYHRFDRQTFTAESAFFAAALGADQNASLFEDRDSMEAQSRPFSAAESIPEDLVLRGTRARVSADERRDIDYLRRLYRTPRERWRAIDADWLNTAAVLALQLDNQTNNTSLAMAIELADGKVLLFPGDAQVGSWLSWHKLSWTVTDGSRTREVKVPELLTRTVFYKVSHHGSHNATLADQGLRMMTSEELVAMIPVDEKVARGTKRWDMPFGPLHRDLRRRARQRVVQIAPMRGKVRLQARAPKGVTTAAWRRFRRSLREHRLYWEYEIAVTSRK